MSPARVVAATGRATSIGLSVLIGIEREAAIELAGGKLTTGVAVHASVHSNRASGDDNPLATTEPAEPARTRLCEDTVRKPATLMEASPLFLDHTRVLACRHVDIVQPRTAGAFAV